MMNSAVKPRGLILRDGEWTIDKLVKGVRIFKRLGTDDFIVAIKRFDAEMAQRAAVNEIDSVRKKANDARKAEINASENWTAYVKAMREDEDSWVLKNHARLLKRGRASGKGCTLTVDELVDLLLESDGKCRVTGIPFSDDIPQGSKVAPFLMSVDRIHNDQGYHFDNCRVVCLMANLAMRDWGEAVVIRMAEAMMLQHLKNKVENSHASWYAEKRKG